MSGVTNQTPNSPDQPHYGPPHDGAHSPAPGYGAPQPSTGAYGAPQPYGTGQYGVGAASWDTGAAAPTGPTGWTPAPKQGLFPLRPLVFGEILGATFKLVRTQPGVTIGTSLLISFATSLLSMAAPIGVMIWLATRITRSTGADQALIANGGVFWILASMVPAILVSYLGSGLLQSVITQVVAAAAVGARTTFGAAWRRAWTRVWSIVGYYALMSLGVLLAAGIIAALVFWSVWLGADRSALLPLPIILIVLLVLGMIVAGIWLSIKLLFVVPSIVLEGLGPIAAIRRSWRLSTGYFWRTLGISWLVQAIVGSVSQVVMSMFSFIPGLVIGVLSPTGEIAEGQEGAVIASIVILYIVILAVSMLVSVLTTILVAGNAVILYTDLRMRKEGLNIHLQRDLEERANGVVPTEDPWTAADLGPTDVGPAWTPPPAPGAPGAVPQDAGGAWGTPGTAPQPDSSGATWGASGTPGRPDAGSSWSGQQPGPNAYGEDAGSAPSSPYGQSGEYGQSGAYGQSSEYGQSGPYGEYGQSPYGAYGRGPNDGAGGPGSPEK